MTAAEPNIGPGQVKQLRHLIATVIANYKSYKVPAVCVRYGLADGTPEEAFNSKYKYVEKRLEALSSGELSEIARALQQDEENFELGELLDKIVGDSRITELTRKRLVAALEHVSISGDRDLIEFLKGLWPIATMPSPARNSLVVSVEDLILQHVVLNDDLTNQEILEAVGIYTCSQSQLFRFLEAVVDPLTRMDATKQKAIVELPQSFSCA